MRICWWKKFAMAINYFWKRKFLLLPLLTEPNVQSYIATDLIKDRKNKLNVKEHLEQKVIGRKSILILRRQMDIGLTAKPTIRWSMYLVRGRKS